MTGVRQVETDYGDVVGALSRAVGSLTTREVAQRCRRTADWALTRLHAASADGLVERLEEDHRRGTRYVWRVRR